MIVLASQSAARGAMLAAAGVPCEIQPAHVDEDSVMASLVGESADHIADTLAEVKATKISRVHPTALVLGADSVVVDAQGSLLNKPETRERAIQQLRHLSGTTHRLVSAAVVAEAGRPIWRATASARLTMRPLSDSFIDGYLNAEGDAVLGCVGTYRIEALGVQLFTRIEGDHFTIRGLPLLPLLDYLRLRGQLPQ